MADDFKLGDLVQLKSGGPVMTVTSLKDAGAVYCCWFGPDEKKRGDSFIPVTLKPAS